MNDTEMKQLAEEDLIRLIGTSEEYGDLEEIQQEIANFILPESRADEMNSCTMEIMQAAGGSESSLFAEVILNMYRNLCRIRGFRLREEHFQKDMAIGRGCKYVSMVIEGEKCYRTLQHESGTHKV